MCNMNTKHHLNILMDKLHLVSVHIAHGKHVKDAFSTSLPSLVNGFSFAS